jgi:hypothetical protein
MIKKLLLLALIAIASEAAAEDAKCIRERGAMIETIPRDPIGKSKYFSC